MKYRISVNATAANIGAGFDCMGLSLDLNNVLTVSDETDFPLEIVAGENVPHDESNLIFRSMREVFSLTGKSLGHIKLVQSDSIPHASGLGSSAACIVAGVTAANALLGFPLSEKQTVNLCARLDGHPDNVLPALLGGITAGVMCGEGVEYLRADVDESICAVALTPDFPLYTELSRKALPAVYPREDVVYSLSRAVLSFAAFALKREDKLHCLDDKLHQPYRKPLIKGYDDAETALHEAGALCVFLSGAGPTVMGIFSKSALKDSICAPEGWTVRKLNFSNKPVSVTRV